MQLKEHFTLLERGDRPIAAYLKDVKSTINELAIINTPLSSNNITLHVLHGLDLDYCDLVTLIHTHETPLTFEELRDLLTSHEAYLQ